MECGVYKIKKCPAGTKYICLQKYKEVTQPMPLPGVLKYVGDTTQRYINITINGNSQQYIARL